MHARPRACLPSCSCLHRRDESAGSCRATSGCRTAVSPGAYPVNEGLLVPRPPAPVIEADISVRFDGERHMACGGVSKRTLAPRVRPDSE